MTQKKLDRLLGAYFDGRDLTEAEESALEDHVAEQVDEENAQDEIGLYVPNEEIPNTLEDQLEELEGYLEESRIGKIKAGAKLTDEERLLFRTAWLHGREESGDLPEYRTVSIAHSDGRTCCFLVLSEGGGWGTVERSFDGPFLNEHLALECLRRQGTITTEAAAPTPKTIENAINSSRLRRVK